MALSLDDLTAKVDNGGVTPDGLLTAEEYNTLLAAVKENAENSTDEHIGSVVVENTLSEVKEDSPKPVSGGAVYTIVDRIINGGVEILTEYNSTVPTASGDRTFAIPDAAKGHTVSLDIVTVGRYQTYITYESGSESLLQNWETGDSHFDLPIAEDAKTLKLYMSALTNPGASINIRFGRVMPSLKGNNATLTSVVEELAEETSFDGTINVMPYEFKQGEAYVIFNEGTSAVNATTRESAGGSVLDDIGTVNVNSNIAFVATKNAHYLRFNTASKCRIKRLKAQDFFLGKAMTQGYINAITGRFEPYSDSLVLADKVACAPTLIIAPKGLKLASIYYYDENGEYVDRTNLSARAIYLDKESGYFNLRLTAIDEGEVSLTDACENSLSIMWNRMTRKKVAYELNDMTTIDPTDTLEGVDFDAKEGVYYKYPTQIIEKFDELVAQHPDRITKIDTASYTELSYPAYCNLNGVASGNYLATPSYTIPMYKVSYANFGEEALLYTKQRQKVLIVAGQHGWENASQLNTFALAKHLITPKSVNHAKLITDCDFYIIPILNLYGAHHGLYVNANGVNLNRNYPTDEWVSGEEGNQYGGSSAGSEFETQLICKIIDTLNPDIVIDHHSYGLVSGYDFYNSFHDIGIISLAENILTNYGTLCATKYTAHFGEILKYRVNEDVFTKGDKRIATLAAYCEYKGIRRSGTIEVCLGIAFKNGVFDVSLPLHTPDNVAINEWMLRSWVVALANNSDYNYIY